MAVVAVASRESLIVKDDREGGISLDGADSIVRFVAMKICDFFKDHPGYTTETDRANIAIILGETAPLLDRYNKGTMGFGDLCDNYHLSLEKCISLSKLIYENPMILIARDEECLSYSGVTLVIRQVKLEFGRETIAVTSGQLSAIRVRSTETVAKVQVVAQFTMVSLRNRVKYYEELPAKISNWYFGLSCVPTVLGGLTAAVCFPVGDTESCPAGMFVGSIALATIGAIALGASIRRCCRHDKC